MGKMVVHFEELTPALQANAGGKGSMLARMYQHKYPVPEGIVVLTSAFQDGKLNVQAWSAVQAYVQRFRSHYGEVAFAVRSSALSEDSAQASYAGEFETVLNVTMDEQIREAIMRVYDSKSSERVKAYSAVKGMEQAHEIAVVIQIMVRSVMSGVLFTADPITGSHAAMVGNYVHGLGEQLVSGEANALSFALRRPKGRYEGPDEFKRYASKVYRLASKLEEELISPQDIEWAVAEGKLYILQTRPITTLLLGNLDTYDWNETNSGDFLWTNTNIGEATPDVMTPLTWSVVRALDEESNMISGFRIMSGNICGRAYTNISLPVSIFPAVGVPLAKSLDKVSQTLGKIPEGMEFPIYPYSRWHVFTKIAPSIFRFAKKVKTTLEDIEQYLADNPDWCTQMTNRIQETSSREELRNIWRDELWPYACKSWWGLIAGGRKFGDASYKLNKELTKLSGTETANALMSNLRGKSGLASLGPVIGISQVLQGTMSREEYLKQYGHRGPHEFELSLPHPGEDPKWLETQIEEYEKSNTNVESLLCRQQSQHEAAWTRFEQKYPQKAKRIRKQIAKASEYAHLREETRSEFVRVYRVIRAFALRAGEISDVRSDVFFLYKEEVQALLAGDGAGMKHVAARKETYEKYLALPPLPTLIRGRFDAFQWANNPERRIDFFDASMPPVVEEGNGLTGFAGASGRVEGTVRVLNRPEEGNQLQSGEILVASTTNVGWTPLFPRAAAIITDVGAPLSHAAIVARELGIPAVVGCGNATTRLRTGDRVIVDGGHGIVQILKG